MHSLPLSLSSLRSDSWDIASFITFTVHLYHHCHPQKSCSPSQAHSAVGHVMDLEPTCYLRSLWRSQGTEVLALDMLYNRVWGHLDVSFQLLFFLSEETLKYEPSPLFIDFWAPPRTWTKALPSFPSSLQLQNCIITISCSRSGEQSFFFCVTVGVMRLSCDLFLLYPLGCQGIASL